MSARYRKQITTKVDKEPMQQDDPISKYDTESHDRQQGSRQDKGDNSRQSTEQNGKARAKSLDKFEITIIIVVIVVIANVIVTIFLSYDAVNKRYDVSANTPDERISKLERRVSEIDKKIDKFESDITEIKKKLETIETEKPWQENFKNLEEKCRNFDATIHEMRVIKEEIPSEEKINEIQNVGSNVNILQQRVDKLDQEWKDSKQSVEDRLKTAEDEVSSLKETFKQVEKKQEDHISDSSQKISKLQTQVREIDDINNKLGKLHTSVENHNETLSNVNSQLKFQEKVHSETRKGNESNFLRNDYAILIVFVVGVLILILFVMVCKTQNVHYDQALSFVEAATGPVSRNFVSSKSVLDQIHQQPLTNEVCIISFYTSTQPLHRRLASSAISDISIKTAVIEKHEHIPMLPHVKTFLVFVDFNERNIILEDPNREIGDLKLTTVQGALKFGGHVYVIYVRDFGSKTLPEGQLINIKLTSINNHSLLRTLNEEKRVLTTYDEFTLYQKQHLKRNIWH